GGQKKRVAMAGALIRPSGLLILDEPTNHIDNFTVDWLEQYLNRRKGALLMVTHDRYFLERVANRILELDHGRLFSYAENYSKYLERKLEREESETASNEKRKNLLRTELKWIQRGARARSTKQKARIDRFEKLKEEKAPSTYSGIEISVLSSRLGKKIVEIEHLSKGFGDRKLIDDFSYRLLRNDRVGIIGPNGSGKTTLLNIIAGITPADSGDVRIGETVKIGYFSQDCAEMDGSLRVIEYMRNIAEYVTTDEGSVSASQMLERFLFPPDMQWTPISKLSGGEKRRLFLLSVLIAAPNVLLLDEPTNDLDIQTLTILEDYLSRFPGAVIAVSHDRFFLDRVVKKILFYDNGSIRQISGAYSDNMDQFDKTPSSGDSAKSNGGPQKPNRTERQTKKTLKLTYKEQRELEGIDSLIAGLEENIKKCKNKMQLSSSDYTKLEELLAKQHSLESELDKAMERWVYLNELKEKIESEKK
ncbi:MAG TPA: ABC-F family ATP-binding cassette domain-containing protein, partial [Clostridia bacterium]|nr:ABC-F family ATP-binding cassette domain-containing protein [Clostridia bacterium]